MKFNVNGTEVEVKGGSGVIVCSKVKRGVDEDGNKYAHAYIGISPDFDVTQNGLSLVFSKRNTVKYGTVGNLNKLRINGWHSIPKIPIIDGVREPLFNPVFLSTTPSFSENGIKYYEVSFASNESFQEYIDNEGQNETAYSGKEGQVTLKELLEGTWGICLFKDGIRISPYAVFKYNGYLYN